MTNKAKTVTLAEVSDVYQTLRALEAVVATHGVTVPSLLLIKSIGEHPYAPVSKHARALQLTPSVVSNALDRIEKRGFVRRVASSAEGGSSDRREVLIELTARGRDLLASLATIEMTDGAPA